MREATEQEYGTKTSCQVLCAVSHLLEAGLPPSPHPFLSLPFHPLPHPPAPPPACRPAFLGFVPARPALNQGGLALPGMLSYLTTLVTSNVPDLRPTCNHTNEAFS